jgi:hypothetical protein
MIYKKITKKEYFDIQKHQSYLDWQNYPEIFVKEMENLKQFFEKTSLEYWKEKLDIKKLNNIFIYEVYEKDEQERLGFVIITKQGMSFETNSKENLKRFFELW